MDTHAYSSLFWTGLVAVGYPVLAVALLGGAAIAGFVAWARVATAPLLDLSLFHVAAVSASRA